MTSTRVLGESVQEIRRTRGNYFTASFLNLLLQLDSTSSSLGSSDLWFAQYLTLMLERLSDFTLFDLNSKNRISMYRFSESC